MIPDVAEVTASLREFRGMWWVFVVFGLLNVATGIIVLVWPDISLFTLAVVTGVFLLVDGAFEIVNAITGRTEAGRGILALVGTLSVIAGLVMVKHPFSAIVAFVIVLGAWLVAEGVMRFVAALSEAESRGSNLLVGAIDLVAGIVVLAWPELGLKTAAILAGTIFILRGVAFSWGGWRARKIPKAAHGATAPAT